MISNGLYLLSFDTSTGKIICYLVGENSWKMLITHGPKLVLEVVDPDWIEFDKLCSDFKCLGKSILNILIKMGGDYEIKDLVQKLGTKSLDDYYFLEEDINKDAYRYMLRYVDYVGKTKKTIGGKY